MSEAADGTVTLSLSTANADQTYCPINVNADSTGEGFFQIILTKSKSTHQIHKSHNAPVPYPTMQHSEQKCAHFCSEWCIVGYGTGALWHLWDWSIMVTSHDCKCVLNHPARDGLFSSFFRPTIKKTSKLRIYIWGKSIGNRWIPLTKCQ